MNVIEYKALQQLQQHCTTLHSTCDVSGWTVHTGKQGLYYLHTATSLAFHTLAAARVAVDAFHCFASKSAADDNDDDDEKDETLSIASCLDDIVAQLHKYTDTLQTQRELTQDAAEVSLALQPKIVDMYDACPYLEINRKSMTLTQQDTLLQRSTKLRCQLLLATCAVFIQKLLNRSSYTSGYRQHCMYTLLQELKRTGPDNAALSMLVEPLLPRAWRKELDRQKLLEGDEDTDLYSVAIAKKDLQQASKEEGKNLEDGFVLVETPSSAKVTGRIKKVYDALDLVPVYKRQQVEAAVADSAGRGLDAMLQCWQEFEKKYAKHKHHQDWLHALKHALLVDEQHQVEEQHPSVIASETSNKQGNKCLGTARQISYVRCKTNLQKC